ncbi:nuclear transport factor 2 family protein [Nocardia sp. FBN12]|uniref:nuclear transport factor 2 family protein n=1 Tax=Nocardia sp. FBN12 TaxID=3419766 RepID=UPI003D070253
MPIGHRTIFTFTENQPPEVVAQLSDRLRSLIVRLPGIDALQCGATSGHGHPASGFELLAIFADRMSLENFLSAPEYRSIVAELVDPQLKSRSSIQFDPPISQPDTRRSDEAAVIEVVLRERAARDTAQWDQMRSAFAADSQVSLTWFTGTGPEFVDASKDMYDRGSRGFHMIGAPSVEIVGDRALAHEGVTVYARGTLADVELDIASHGRLYQRLIKADGQWRITDLTMLYYKDVVSPVNPAADTSALADIGFPVDRPYKYLAALLDAVGYTVGPDLPGPDRPELAAQYIAAHRTWLHEPQG